MIRFSVIVPTHNRPRQLRDCLTALAQQEFPRDQYEVIVVDDGSEPPVEVPDGVTLLRQPNAGPAAARNAGARAARGEWLAFTDDDCAPSPGWLAALAAEARCMAGGRTVNALRENCYAEASQLLIEYLYGYYNADPQQARFLTSNNFALPAAEFRALGGFDTALRRAAGEDRDLCDRWLAAGHAMIYVPGALVEHAHELTLRGFWRQHFQYGRAAFYFHQQRARRGAGRMRMEPVGFYLRLLRYPFGRAPESFRQAALLALSQAANALGYFAERFRARPTTDSAQYWNQVGAEWQQTHPDALWRAHSDAVNRDWLASWWPGRNVERVLKTDMFDEAVGEGVFGLLKSRARFAVGMDIALTTKPDVGADVRQVPFADGAFDLIVSNSTLDHFQRKEELIASLRELRRVLRPGGELLLTLDNAANPFVAIRNLLPFALLHRLGLTPYQVGITCGPARLRRLLRETGFEVGKMGALLHCPRVLAVKRAAAVQQSGDAAERKRFLAGLMKWERLARWPTRWLTGYFVAVRAVRSGVLPQ